MEIKVNGKTYTINGKEDLAKMRREHYADWYAIRSSNKTLILWALDLYQDELDRQDLKASTGSYGKLKEVIARVEYAVANGQRIYLHDIRCRKQSQVDQLIKGQAIEHKSGFAQWAYCASYEDGMNDLLKKAKKGLVYSWDPFKDGREIVMPLSDLLEKLASYNPSKGLSVWFSFKATKGQLQLQPVTNSKKRAAFIEAMLEE